MKNNSSSSTPQTSSSILMTYATYNLGKKILSLKLELYLNSQPHRHNPNPLWKRPLIAFRKTQSH